MMIKKHWLNWREIVIDDSSLSPGAKGIALFLNTYMNDQHDFAFPSIETIRKRMGYGSNSTVIKYLNELETSGWIQREKRFGNSTKYKARISEKFTSITESVVLQDLEYSITESVTPVLQDLEPNNQMNNQMNNQLNNQKGGRAKKQKFKRPTVEEVRAYCEERKNNIDPEYFVDSNNAKGWVVGTTKSPMVDWKAVIRTWEKRSIKPISDYPARKKESINEYL